MFMEDILSKLLTQPMIHVRAFNYNILTSFHEQNLKQLGLTQKQRNLLEKIFRGNSEKLSNSLQMDVTPFVNAPQYRLPLRILDQGKLVSIVNDAVYGKKIKISFPYDKVIIADIQSTRNQATLCNWDSEQRAWTMPLLEKNIAYLKTFVKNHEFLVTPEVSTYFLQHDRIVNDIENYVPMVVAEENDYFLKNLKNLKNLAGDNLIEKLFDARKKGVIYWDAKIEEILENFEVSTSIKDFLKINPIEKFSKKSQEIDEDDLVFIFKNLNPCLIVIPVTDSLLYVQRTMKILEKVGFSVEEISVMFRLPNATDKDFNQFIKDKKLNNPISEKTKAVFVSGKITKPIFESRMYFHSVLSYTSIFPHYVISNFLKNQANIISIE